MIIFKNDKIKDDYLFSSIPNKQEFVEHRIKMSFLSWFMLHNPENKLHNSYILMNPTRLDYKIPEKNYLTRCLEQAGRNLFYFNLL